MSVPDGAPGPGGPEGLEVLYEDNHLLVINKPWSRLVQGDKTGDPAIVEDVAAYIKERYSKPGNVFMGVPHRLDRPTSGVLILARTSKALSRMAELFRRGEVHKTYWAVVDRRPPETEGRLEHHLTKNEPRNKSTAHDGPVPGAKKAVLTWRLLASGDRYHLLEVVLETGRHHQIRAQLSRIGCHIKGDLKYGARRSNPGGGIHLHARSVRFTHPVRDEEIEVEAPPPSDPLWDFFVSAVARQSTE